MSVRDLNVDLQAHLDRVLIMSPDPRRREELARVLGCRPYHLETVSGFDSARSHSDLFDLVVIDGLEIPTEEIVASVRSDPLLRRSATLILHQSGTERTGPVIGESEVLPAEATPSEILVKVSALLRVRKLRAEQREIDVRLTAQNAELRDLTNRFMHELKEAQEIQRSILPVSLPQDPCVEFAARYLPLEAVGGDLYDVIRIDEKRWALFVGDVSGHGLPAALISSMTKMALSYARKSSALTFLQDLNNGLSQHMPSGRFLTAAVAFYDTGRHSLSVTRGGHPPGFLWRAQSKAVEIIQPKGTALGIASDADFEVYESEIAAGDRFLFVTDGVTETASMEGNQLGVAGLREVFANCCGETLDATLESILLRRTQFSGGRMDKDDITLVALSPKL